MPPFNGLSVQMTAYMDPKDLPQFWELFRPVFEKVIAEPHCTFFEVYQSPEDPGTISWIENWFVSPIPTLSLS
jgi:quinol monooxygenase YgiN